MIVYFNPACSKCRDVKARLEARGVDATYREYLKEAPTKEELRHVLTLLGTEDPRAIMRSDDALYGELRLGDADADALLDAMVANPKLIQRPIVITEDRAVVARPVDKIEELLAGR